MKVHIAINLMHCRGHFRKKKKKERPLIRKAHTHAQKKSPLATGEKRTWYTSCQLEESELRATSILIIEGLGGAGAGRQQQRDRERMKRRDLYHHKAQEATLKQNYFKTLHYKLSGIISDGNATIILTVTFIYFINIYVNLIYFYNLHNGYNCHLLLQVSTF